MNKFGMIVLCFLGLQLTTPGVFAADRCGSSAYQYALQFCEKTTGVTRGKSYSLNSINCFWAADYMEAHSQTSVEDVETICERSAPVSSAKEICQMAMWAYMRARK